MIAAATPLPVIGVPVAITALAGIDALLSIAQMPAGVPVATVAIDGARNAGLLAVRILGAVDPDLRAAMIQFQAAQADRVRVKDATVRAEFFDQP
jgi:5-(carboxyamino)imidazole ribonucleotide mutase